MSDLQTVSVVVGKAIKKRKHLAKLPDGSVVVNRGGHALLISEGLSFGADCAAQRLDDETHAAPPYRVIHLSA